MHHRIKWRKLITYNPFKIDPMGRTYEFVVAEALKYGMWFISLLFPFPPFF